MERVGVAKSMVEGRLICECNASVHGLLNNCAKCGKIICEYEGAGICPFCGDLPKPLDHNNIEYEKALQRSATLLDYQINSAQRTRVLDTAADYDIGDGQFNKWTSAEERAMAISRLHDAKQQEEDIKRRRIITLDLENKRVLIVKETVKLAVKTKLEEKESEIGPVGVYRKTTLKKPNPIFIARTSQKPKLQRQPTTWDTKRLQDELFF